MAEQGKDAPETIARPPDSGPGGLARALRAIAVLLFLGFAAWSIFEFITYSPAIEQSDRARLEVRFFLDPALYPNSLAVTGWRDYFGTFGERQGLDPLVRQAWRISFVPWWSSWFCWMMVIWVLVHLLYVIGLGRSAGRSIPFALLMGTLALDTLFQTWFRHPILLIPWITVGAVAMTMLTRGARGASAPRLFRETVWKDIWRCRLTWRRWPIWLPVFALLSLAFLAASTPAVQSDGLRYHLPAPWLWVHRGNFEPIEGMAFSQFPFLIEMWYVIAMRVDNEILAKLFHFSFLLVTLGIVAGLTRRIARWAGVNGRRLLTAIAVTLAVTIPALTITATWSFIDAGVACFLIAATFAHALWWHTGQPRHLILAAALAGFSIGTKYTMLVPMFALGLGVLACGGPALRGRDWRYTLLERLMNGLVFGVVSLVIAAPWFIRNWVQMGNPVYPLLNDIFQAPGWDAEAAALWARKAAEKGLEPTWSNLLPALRVATFDWTRFEDQSVGLTPWLLAPLGLGGLLLLAIRRGGWWLFHLLFIALNAVLWFGTYQSNRMLMPVIVLALPATVVGLAWLARNWRALWIAALITLGAMSLYQGLWIARYFLVETCAPQLALGYWDHDAWRSERIGYFEAARAMQAQVPAGDRILVVGESRRLHMPDGVVMGDWFDPPPLRRFLAQAQTPDDLSALFADAGITHVFFHHGELLPVSVWSRLWGDGADSTLLWRAWAGNALGAIPQSNLAHHRRGFTDEQAVLWFAWMESVPHDVIWRGEDGGSEVWRMTEP